MIDFISFPSLWSLLLPVVISFAAILITLYVIQPYRKVHSYKKEGVITYFFPILGFFHYNDLALKKTGDIITNMREISKHTPNPKYLVSHISRTPLIVLYDAQYIKEYLLKQNLLYTKGTFIDPLRPLGGNGLVGAEGETWKRHRKIISNSFNFEFLKKNVPIIQSTTKEFFANLSPEDYKGYSGISRIQDITGEIVGRIFFGENLNSYTVEGKSLTVALAEITSELSQCDEHPLVILFGSKVMKVPIIPTFRRLLRRAKNFRQVCFKIIQDRRSKGQLELSQDLLSSLLATQSSPDPELRFSDENIVDEFITFFIAGMDTTGHLVGMTLYNLTQHPEYLEKLQKERDNTYNMEEHITTDTLTKMEALHAFLKETLRFHTPAPVPFTREAVCDHDLLDLKVKKGEIVFPSFLTPAFDEKHFESPYQFNPERWIHAESKMDPYAFTPFSAGPRNCIGQHLAMMEAKVIVSEFLEQFDFSLKEGYKLRMIFRFLYEPDDELLFVLKPKKQ